MKRVVSTILAAAGFIATTVHGDALLTYELAQQGKEARVQKVAIARFFARVDDSAKPDTYLLYQAGKFFPLFEVNPSEKTYQQLTPEVKPTLQAGSSAAKAKAPTESPAAGAPAEQNKAEEVEAAASESAEKTAAEQPAPVAAADATEQPAPTSSKTASADPDPAKAEQTADAQGGPTEAIAVAGSAQEKPTAPAAQAKAKPELRATRDTRQIAGIECRLIEEIEDGEPVMQHCMANKARLGISERETRTLARLFTMARERGYGWLGAGTTDEDFVSIQARNLTDGSELILKSVSTKPLPAGYLRISPEFKQTKP